MLNQAVILCGGLGSRLGKLTKKTPKPLLKINDKCFIDYQIKNLARQGVKDIILLCCYKYKQFKKKYFDKLFTLFKNFLFETISITLLPTDIANGLPPNVDP